MSAKGVVKILNRSQATVVCSALTVLCGARRCRHSRKVQSPLLALSGHGLLHCTCLLSGVKRTWLFARHMSAFDPKRTFALRDRDCVSVHDRHLWRIQGKSETM